jgi:hypothetical protein
VASLFDGVGIGVGIGWGRTVTLVFCEPSEQATHRRYNNSIQDKVEHRKNIYYNHISFSYFMCTGTVQAS